MSEDGEPDEAEAAGDGAADVDPPALDEEAIDERLDEAAEALEAAETEADLDGVAAQLDAAATAIEEADFPEPDDEDEDPPGERLSDRLESLRGDLEAARGPYVEDVAASLRGTAAEVPDAEWTDAGAAAVVDAVAAFRETVAESVDVPAAEDPAGAAEAVETAADRVADLDLDPDDDAPAVAALMTAADSLAEDVEAAEVWDDLTVREQLDAEGFYDVLDPKNRKDFPAEWNAVKLYEQAGEVEPMLTALERFGSDFMEENVLDALEHIAPAEAFEAVHERAQKRDKQAVRVLGRIGDDRACETLEEFLGGGDYKLELVTLRALGAIGSRDSTQAVANRLVADNDDVRSTAARALGQIGDTRAIEPLADVLAEDDVDAVRASAAWALVQIGTERALEAAAGYTDDRSYLVQTEAEKAASV